MRSGGNDGTTASVAVIDLRERQLTLGNVGDSRAVVFSRGGRAMYETPEDKASDPSEIRRIQSLGGSVRVVHGVHRVGGVLAVSRAIGDAFLKPFVASEPHVYSLSLGGFDGAEKDDNDLWIDERGRGGSGSSQSETVPHFLVIASDGLWDAMTSEEVGKVVAAAERGRDPLEISRQLVSEAVRRTSPHSDNVTVMVVDLSLKGSTRLTRLAAALREPLGK